MASAECVLGSVRREASCASSLQGRARTCDASVRSSAQSRETRRPVVQRCVCTLCASAWCRFLCVGLPLAWSAVWFAGAVPNAWQWALGVHVFSWYMQVCSRVRGVARTVLPGRGYVACGSGSITLPLCPCELPAWRLLHATCWTRTCHTDPPGPRGVREAQARTAGQPGAGEGSEGWVVCGVCARKA